MEILKDVILSFHYHASKPLVCVFENTCTERDVSVLGCPDTRVVFYIQCLFLEGSLQSRGAADMFCCFCGGSACLIPGLTALLCATNSLPNCWGSVFWDPGFSAGPTGRDLETTWSAYRVIPWPGVVTGKIKGWVNAQHCFPGLPAPTPLPGQHPTSASGHPLPGHSGGCYKLGL